MSDERVYKYQGGGFVPGIPARDLTESEAKQHGVTNHPLYKKDKNETAKKAVKKDGE